MNLINELFSGPWGPLIIFSLRIVDVSLATVRMLLMMRNAKVWTPILAFFEVLIWVFAAGSAIKNLGSPLHLLGYAGGFSMGTLAGMWLEEKLAFGYATARIITKRLDSPMSEALRELGFGVTEFDGKGREGPVKVLVSVIPRKDLEEMAASAQKVDPEVFVTIEETRSIQRGWLFPRRRK